MTGRKSVITISVLCVMAFAAFSAADAAAAQRAYACAEESPHEYEDQHCLNSNTTSGPYTTVLLPESATNITATNEKTASGTTAATVEKLAGSLTGVETEIRCTGLSGTGSLTNAASSVTGTGTFTYSGCTITRPAGQGCAVTGGSVTTKTLKATTVGQAANKLKFTPNSGSEFASVPISGCSNTNLNHTFPVTGSLVANTSGATTSVVHAEITAQETLLFGGVEAGLEGSVTTVVETCGVVLK